MAVVVAREPGGPDWNRRAAQPRGQGPGVLVRATATGVRNYWNAKYQ